MDINVARLVSLLGNVRRSHKLGPSSEICHLPRLSVLFGGEEKEGVKMKMQRANKDTCKKYLVWHLKSGGIRGRKMLQGPTNCSCSNSASDILLNRCDSAKGTAGQVDASLRVCLAGFFSGIVCQQTVLGALHQRQHDQASGSRSLTS